MATYDDLDVWIRTENATTESVEDQVTVARWFVDRQITRLHDRVARTSQVADHLEGQLRYQPRTSLDNLADIGVLDQLDPPGSGRYIRHHRSETNFYDPSAREFVPFLQEDLARLLADLATSRRTPQLADGGNQDELREDDSDNGEQGVAGVPSVTIRTVAADTLAVPEDAVEDALTEPEDPFDRMNRYDAVVTAIKASDEVSRGREYDEMGWRNMALRWTLSKRATHMTDHHPLHPDQ